MGLGHLNAIIGPIIIERHLLGFIGDFSAYYHVELGKSPRCAGKDFPDRGKSPNYQSNLLPTGQCPYYDYTNGFADLARSIMSYSQRARTRDFNADSGAAGGLLGASI